MNVKFFTELDRKSVLEAGGKGASLGEMTSAKIPVPPGFVVLAAAFDRFLAETDLDSEVEAILKKVNAKDVNSVDKASAEIRDLIHREQMPKDLQKEIVAAYDILFPSLEGRGKGRVKGLVAVRSSATAEDSKVASWAGELETYLNVQEKGLIRAVMKCWSSLFTPRAIFYRFEKKLHRKPVSVAVVVQEMVQSEISGVAFTVHPVTKDYNQMVIEAGFGLGEAIVSGQITPDTYVVHKNDFSILDINVSEQKMAIVRSAGGDIHKNLSVKVGSKQKLTGKQIVTLAKICKGIEKHYKHPQDIEWAYVKGKFYITQSRPITTL
ncbi:MAG: PEP/pyruvate-binding domain-containing protein [Candidatus Doudnabacteria bacterium]|nr:PEP/pyruvate-binding domain-containing protein [Candidatus Doudnabacteria bacterium]MBI4363539.1 PEP/pyruvate-binding domain-containing protein [Candidatus Doudnabacteria bacterium]